MKRTIILTISFHLFLNVISFGQNLDSLIKHSSEYIDNIFKNRPDMEEIIFLLNSCPGSIETEGYQSECNFEEIYYIALVLSFNDQETVIKRFDPCYEFQEYRTTLNSTEYYLNQRDSIIGSELEPQKCLRIMENDTSYYTTFSHHSCFTEITWLSKSDTIKATEFRLEDYIKERFVGEPNPNINAPYNASLPLLKWYIELMPEIKELEQKRKFKR